MEELLISLLVSSWNWVFKISRHLFGKEIFTVGASYLLFINFHNNLHRRTFKLFFFSVKFENIEHQNNDLQEKYPCKTFYGTEFAKEKWKLFVLPLLVFILSRYRAEDNSSQIEVCLNIFWNYWSLQCDVLKCRIKVIPWYNLHCILTAHIILWIISMHIIAFSLWQSLSEL